MKNYLLMKSKEIPTYLKYYLSKTRLDGLVFNKTYIENLSGTSFYLDHSIEDKIKINLKASDTTQDGTPTPDNPQEIHVVKGDNNVVIENKNIYNGEYEVGGYDVSTGEKTTNKFQYRNTNFIEVEPNTTYVFSINGIAIIENPRYFYYDKDKNKITSEVVGSVFTTPNNCYFLNWHSSGLKTNYPDGISNAQIEVGSVASPYIAHEEQNYPITLGDKELCKIGNYQDLLFKNTSDSEYYDSTLESGKWYKYAKIGKIILDGSENWEIPSGIAYSLPKNHIINANLPVNTITNYIVNNFTKVEYPDTFVIGTCRVGSSYINFNFDGTDDNLNNFKEWLNENNIILYYILETPTYTLLSDTLQTQLDNIYNNAHTYDKITNITQINDDRPFILDISYFRKVK